jgi:hypothetical protein
VGRNNGIKLPALAGRGYGFSELFWLNHEILVGYIYGTLVIVHHIKTHIVAIRQERLGCLRRIVSASNIENPSGRFKFSYKPLFRLWI